MLPCACVVVRIRLDWPNRVCVGRAQGEQSRAAALTESRWAQAGHGGGHGPMDEEEDSKHVHNLMDENSSLRSLNMSLIYEREKLLRELRQCDTEMVSMQRAVDGLLQATSSAGKAENNGPLCQVRAAWEAFFSAHLRCQHAYAARPAVTRSYRLRIPCARRASSSLLCALPKCWVMHFGMHARAMPSPGTRPTVATR